MTTEERFQLAYSENPAIITEVMFYHAENSTKGKPDRSVFIVTSDFGSALFMPSSRGAVVKFEPVPANVKKNRSAAFFALKNAGFEKHNISTEEGRRERRDLIEIYNLACVSAKGQKSLSAKEEREVKAAILELYGITGGRDWTAVAAEEKAASEAKKAVAEAERLAAVASFYHSNPNAGSF